MTDQGNKSLFMFYGQPLVILNIDDYDKTLLHILTISEGISD